MKNKKAKEIKKVDAKTDKNVVPQLNAPKLSKEMEDKLKELKGKLDKFKDKIIEKFDKYIIGVVLLPPEQKPAETSVPSEAGIVLAQSATACKADITSSESSSEIALVAASSAGKSLVRVMVSLKPERRSGATAM